MAGAWEGGRGVCQPEGAGLLVREREEGHGTPLRERGEDGEGECDGSAEVGDMPGGPLTLKPRCSSGMGKIARCWWPVNLGVFREGRLLGCGEESRVSDSQGVARGAGPLGDVLEAPAGAGESKGSRALPAR